MDQSHSTTGATLVVGSRNNPLCAQTFFAGDVYSFAVTNRAGRALLDLMPCRRRDTGQIGFFDRVSARFLILKGNLLFMPLGANVCEAGLDKKGMLFAVR